MKFTKLRILGFKSFVEPTEFLIENGLTGVVGPNGCGKSNLVEAIKWVMGESSYKNMRASGMDDVIFSGSANRPARNNAEVTLFLDNHDRKAPAGFNDSDTIEITRRIERESGSVYRINGKEARARDVQLLFADASTSARSPSMVGQGRIGELISAKPRQRRMILEEAAGISGLHTRRHEAELRLRAAEQNLDRVEDIVGQLETQLEGLKRQARQANRYRNLSGDIRKAEATLSYVRWKSTCANETEADEVLKEITLKVADVTSRQAKTARDQAVIANSLPNLRDKAASAAATLQRLRLAQTVLERDEEQAKHRLKELAQRIEQLNQDAERERALVGDNQAVLKRLDDEEADLKKDVSSFDEKRTTAKDTVVSAEEKLKASETAYNETTREIAEINAKRSNLDNMLKQAQRQVVSLEADIQKTDRDLVELDTKLNQDLFIKAHRETLEEINVAVNKAEADVWKSEEDTQAQRDKQKSIQEATTDFEKELGALEAEAKTLASVLNVGARDDWAMLIDDVTAEPGYEKALAVALGDDLEASTDSNAPVHWHGAAVNKDDPALPTGAVPLANFVSAPDLVSRRLQQIGVIGDESGAELAQSLKVGQRLVSRDGALWRWDGLQSKSGAETPAAQRLEQKNRLADLEGYIKDKARQVESQRTLLKEAGQNLEENIKTERAARENLKALQAKQRSARDELARAEAELSRITERKNSFEERKTRLQKDLEKAQEAQKLHQENFEAVPEISSLDERLKAEQLALTSDREETSKAKAVFETLNREADMRNKRLASIVAERKSWSDRAEAAQKQISVLDERRQAAIDECKTLEDAPADFQRKRVALFSEIEKAEKDNTEARGVMEKAEAELNNADKAARDALNDLSTIREQRVRAEERLENAKTRKKDFIREIAENLECAPSELCAMAGLTDDSPLPDPDGVERRLDRLKNERERLGGVNLRAEVEIEEVTEKRETLIRERDDLISAIRQLRTAIANLNKEGRERLLAAFDEVNNHFKNLFTHLFGGGTAELQLTESDDPLEAGLDIMARPPGKKPQTMTLLSGGEQALTAMALIFAVFLTNPAPICVLDEVDAPLDDANVERFCNLLDDMKGTTDTRFLMITHNPITMARMNRLFGVTMAERGVSQIVSVDLQTAESYREAG